MTRPGQVRIKDDASSDASSDVAFDGVNPTPRAAWKARDLGCGTCPDLEVIGPGGPPISPGTKSEGPSRARIPAQIGGDDQRHVRL